MIRNRYKYILNSFLFLLVFLIQIYFPIINIGEIYIQADIVLLYITVLAILYGRFIAIVIGFIAGLFQDFSTQNELLGIFSLTKPVTAYCLGSIFNYKTIWSKKIQYCVVFMSYILHFFIYFYLFARNIFDFYYLFIFIGIHSVIVFILLIILNNLVYKNKLL